MLSLILIKILYIGVIFHSTQIGLEFAKEITQNFPAAFLDAQYLPYNKASHEYTKSHVK